MSTAAQTIEWIFSSPFIWMAILGIVTAYSMRSQAIRTSLPYAPLIEEKTENTMGRRMLLSFAIGTAAALFLYFTKSALSFTYILAIWFIAFIIIAQSKVAIAFLLASLIIGTISYFIDGVDVAYKVMRFSGSYQLTLGLLYLIGKKETYPVMQKQKDGSISGEHMYKEVWLLPAAALSLADSPIQLLSYVLIVMLLICEIRIKCVTPEKYFKRNGTFMAITGAVFVGLSFVGNQYLFIGIQFIIVPAIVVLWIIKQALRAKQNKCTFVASDEGVQVFYVYENSPASVMKLKIGDVIVSINSHRVIRNEAIDAILEDRPPFIWLEVLRDEKKIEVEYKDYKKGIDTLGIVHTPFNPSKYELYPRPGFFARQNIRVKSIFNRRK